MRMMMQISGVRSLSNGTPRAPYLHGPFDDPLGRSLGDSIRSLLDDMAHLHNMGQPVFEHNPWYLRLAKVRLIATRLARHRSNLEIWEA